MQAGIKIGGRNINNLKYADDTILIAESKEEIKSLLMKVKEESEKVGLPVADSFWCLAKLIQCSRFKNKIKLN